MKKTIALTLTLVFMLAFAPSALADGTLDGFSNLSFWQDTEKHSLPLEELFPLMEEALQGQQNPADMELALALIDSHYTDATDEQKAGLDTIKEQIFDHLRFSVNLAVGELETEEDETMRQLSIERIIYCAGLLGDEELAAQYEQMLAEMSKPLVAKPSNQTVLVNGEAVAFDAYNINGSNYFKLRDLAFVLSGTEKQFEVSWDSATATILLISGEEYTPNGSEMAAKGDTEKTPVVPTLTVTLDGEVIELEAYNIEGNNYFKVRDFGIAMGIFVDYDEAARAIIIDTTK